MSQQLSISQSPNCNNTLSFSFTSSKPNFVSISIDSNIGFLNVEGAALADQNFYALTLQAQADAKSVDCNFNVEISDPCKRAIFPVDSPITDMVLIRDFESEKTQTFWVNTDIETNHSLVCSFVASLVNPPSYVTL